MKVRQGFTLVEIMIVVAIIGILMAYLTPKLAGYFAKANDVGRQSELQNIVSVMNDYYSMYSSYPNAAFCLEGTDTDESIVIGTSRTNGGNITVGDIKDLFSDSVYPEDPTGNVESFAGCNGYYYLPAAKTVSSRNATSYIVFSGAESDASVQVDCGMIGSGINTDGSFYIGDLTETAGIGAAGDGKYQNVTDIDAEGRCMYTTGG